jgi:hypothetical protein
VRIIAKMNALLEPEIIEALYDASQAGVKIDLIVRGACALRPGIPGLSENISVRSIVGRFLEHTRIFYFYADGAQKMYLSSADWMDRNFFRRIELCFPVLEPEAQAPHPQGRPDALPRRQQPGLGDGRGRQALLATAASARARSQPGFSAQARRCWHGLAAAGPLHAADLADQLQRPLQLRHAAHLDGEAHAGVALLRLGVHRRDVDLLAREHLGDVAQQALAVLRLDRRCRPGRAHRRRRPTPR